MAKEVVSGTHKTGKGNWDGMHKFGSGDGTWANLHGWIQFGSIGKGKIPTALQSFYKKYNLNPCITSVKFTVDPVNYKVDWEFTIEESPDGNAYVGFSSWGGASGGYPKKSPPASHAYPNYKKEYNAAVGIKGAKVADVIDLYFPGGFRQIFFQHTWPQKYPNLPKSAGLKEGTVGVKIGPSGSPKNLPEYSGVLVQTTSVDSSADQGTSGDQPPTTDQNVEKTENAANNNNKAAADPGPTKISKIKLVKKSGPGELMGEVEKETIFGEAVFEGLQFDEPGEYVISVTTEAEDIEPTEFTIKVEGDPSPKQQEPKGEEEKKTDGNRPIIAQIDKTTYKLRPIKLDAGSKDLQTQDYLQSLGNTPLFWYNTYQIESRDILQMSLFHDGIVPCCNVVFSDSNGLMKRDGMPLDDTTFEIFLNSGSPNLKSIHMKFKLTNFQQNKSGNYTVTGSIDLKDFYKINYKAYKGTSFKVMRDIAKELELGYNSNINDTQDEMKWVNTGKTWREFIGQIVEHSYISDNSFVMGYIDFYYCFNYVDIEKEWSRNNNTDVGLDSKGLSQVDRKSEESDKIVPMILIKDDSQRSSSFFFHKEIVKNNSTQKSVTKGQFTITKFYDSASKSFLIFDVNSLTSTGNDKLILKGKPADGKDLVENFRTKFGGRIDMSNSHKNYLYSPTQNKVNFDNLTRISCEMELPNGNFNLYKFQKIKIYFVNSAPTVTEPDKSQVRLNGDWMVVDISYNWSRGKLTQNIVVARKELSKLPEEVEEQKDETKPETKEGNSNEEKPLDPPNSAYAINEVYYVEGEDGKKFQIVITRLEENGNEVTGSVLEQRPQSQPSPGSSGTSGTSGTSATSGTSGTSGTSADSVVTNKLLSATYVDNADGTVTAKATFEISGKEVDGTGTAGPDPAGKGKQKENATKLAEQDAVNKSKQPAQTVTNSPENKVSNGEREYILGIPTPETEGNKKITGKITFQAIGPKRNAVGVLSGFPDGGTIGPIKGPQVPAVLGKSDETYQELADGMVGILKQEIINKYNIDAKLTIIEKKN
jgi:hypothetical protein